jgi:hypothetical protein
VTGCVVEHRVKVIVDDATPERPTAFEGRTSVPVRRGVEWWEATCCHGGVDPVRVSVTV